MTFNLGALMSGLRTGLSAVEQISATATALGAPAGLLTTAAKVGGALLEAGQNAALRVEEGSIVATSQEQDQLKAIVASIQTKNDELAAYIEAH